MSAHSSLAAFVVVNALPLVRGWVEAWWTGAVEASLPVLALPSPAHPLQTLVHVPALFVSRHLEAGLTVAAITLCCVHTVAVGAEVRPEGALVNPGDANGGLLAEQPVFLGPRRGTFGAVGSLAGRPTLTHCLAATAIHP